MARLEDSSWLGDLRVVAGEWTACGLFAFATVETRLRVIRHFVDLVQRSMDDEQQAIELRVDVLATSASEPTRRLTQGEEASASGLQRRLDAMAMLPQLAWRTALTDIFSTLESFLSECAQEFATATDQTSVTNVTNPKLEGWLRELARLGVRARVPPNTLTRLRAARRVRNVLVHGGELHRRDVHPLIRDTIVDSRVLEIVPTRAFVLVVLIAAEQLVAAADYAVVESGYRLGVEPLRVTGHGWTLVDGW
jgi:hypothetical protein